MKAILILILFLLNRTYAQERSVQLKQMIKLKVQSALNKEKNNQDEQGLRKVEQQKNGSYQLFKDYFNSLTQVNGNIRNSDKVQNIKVLDQSIRRTFEVTLKNASNSGLYEQSEIQHFRKTYQKILADCRQILSNLDFVLVSGPYKMTDAQRLQRIDQLYEQMVSNFRFTKVYCSDIDLLRLSRQREKRDIQTLRELHVPAIENR